MSSGASGLVSGNALGTIYFGGNYNTTPTYTYPASISAIAEANWTSTSAAAAGLAFYTGATGQSLGAVNTSFGTERMRIDSNGAIIVSSTIGTTSSRPAVGTSRIAGEIAGAYTSIGSDGGFLRLSAGGGTNASTKSYIDLSGYSTDAALETQIQLGTAGVPRMTINVSGKVLIGTTTTTADADTVFQVGRVVTLYKQVTVASGSYIDFTVTTSNLGYWTGFLGVTNSDVGNGSYRTQTTFSLITCNQFSDFSTQTLHTINGSLGARSFTVTYVATGVIRITNTSGNTCVLGAFLNAGGLNI
jgi:hypothetical protein